MMNNPKTQQGFTLLEMLIVLAILAILTPIIISFAGRQTARLQLEEGSQTLTQGLNEARSAARKTSRDQFVRLDFDTGKQVYRVRICSSEPTVAAALPEPAVTGVANAAACDAQSKWKDTALPPTVKVFRLTAPGADLNVGSGQDITYNAPYSRVSLSPIGQDLQLEVRSKNYADLTSKVNILGVTGKVNKLDRF